MTESKRILLAVSGMSSQILTETLYVLVTQPEPFIPDQIYLISTIEGADRAKLDLLHSETGKFHKLCEDYSLPPISFSTDDILVITDKDGEEMADIRSHSDNESAADFITQRIRKITAEPNTILHASMAGGRKTMGYYLGYALSLYGRKQDSLSHVLVPEGYDGHRDFFYPSPKSHVIYARDNKPLDTHNVKVELANIPFIRLRDNFSETLLKKDVGFSDIVSQASRLTDAPMLTIDLHSKTLHAHNIKIELKPTLFAFYTMFVKSALDGESITVPHELEPNQDYAHRFLDIYKSQLGEMRDTDKTEFALKNGMDANFFTEKISRIKNGFEVELGKTLAAHYKITRTGKRGSGTYMINLPSEQIDLKE